MLEVTFSLAVCGSLFAAKHKFKAPEFKNSEIIGFDLMLDIGYLKEETENLYCRKFPDEFLDRWTYYEGYNDDDDDPDEWCVETANRKSYERLKTAIDNGEDIRIWYGDCPGDICAFYYICSVLCNGRGNVFEMKCPCSAECETGYYFIGNWALISPENLSKYIVETKKIQQEEILLCADWWKKLEAENAPMRAVISGRPISVDEDFYDEFIEKSLPEDPIKQNRFESILMGCLGFGLSHLIYKSRIQALIDRGEIEVVEDSEDQGKRIIKKRKSCRGC